MSGRWLVPGLALLVGLAAACQGARPRPPRVPENPKPLVLRPGHGTTYRSNQSGTRRPITPPTSRAATSTHRAPVPRTLRLVDPPRPLPKVTLTPAFSIEAVKLKGIQLDESAGALFHAGFSSPEGVRATGGTVGIEWSTRFAQQKEGGELRWLFSVNYEGYSQAESFSNTDTVVTGWGPLECFPSMYFPIFCWRSAEEWDHLYAHRSWSARYNGALFTTGIEAIYSGNALRIGGQLGAGYGVGTAAASVEEARRAWHTTVGGQETIYYDEHGRWHGQATMHSLQFNAVVAISLTGLPHRARVWENLSVRAYVRYRLTTTFELESRLSDGTGGTADYTGWAGGGGLGIRF